MAGQGFIFDPGEAKPRAELVVDLRRDGEISLTRPNGQTVRLLLDGAVFDTINHNGPELTAAAVGAVRGRKKTASDSAAAFVAHLRGLYPADPSGRDVFIPSRKLCEVFRFVFNREISERGLRGWIDRSGTEWFYKHNTSTVRGWKLRAEGLENGVSAGRPVRSRIGS